MVEENTQKPTSTQKGTSKPYVKKKKPHFQRTKFRAYVKLGSGQKSKQRYKKATGRHNKTRQQWKSRPKRVEVGYKNKVDTRGLIEGKMPVEITTMEDLKNIQENQIAVIAKIGIKKKLEIVKEAEKMKIEFLNLNIKKFLRDIERKTKHKKKIKDERKSKKVKAEKKAEKKEKKEEESKDKKETKEEAKPAEEVENKAEIKKPEGDKK